ncbi:RNA polymerase sigma factor [Streptomyces virginiae]|uniref:RNA polymerase sigma factor n=1 Tax=Streptomyces virginiae TaxID=1961 RepID=UPI00371A4A3D
MEDAASPELLVEAIPDVQPLEAPAVALPGRELAEALHHEQYPALVRFLLFAGASWPEAQDAAQDAFTKMCTPGLTISRPKAWLRTVAWRSWVSQKVRPEDAFAELPEPEVSLRWHTPAQAAEIGEEARQVMAHLLKLPSKQRAALAWNLDGFTTEESARAMGTTQVAVRQNLSRARAAMKAQFQLHSEYQDDEAPKGES